MNHTQNILIRDPYMTSANKTDHFQHRSFSATGREDPTPPLQEHSKWKIDQQLKREVEASQKQFKRMQRAYTDENKLNKKILDFQQANTDYHESLKLRNLELNNKLTTLAADKQVMTQHFETDYLRNYHEKDLLLKKYQDQCEELLQAKKTINSLIEHKSRLEEEIHHLAFTLEKETDRFNLEMREQMIRMEGMERAMKNVGETKDEEIGHLRHRIRIYEDENKRLCDENRTLQITTTSQAHFRNNENKNIDNLSHINYNDSNTKDWPENRTFKKELQEQKQINDKLQKDINEMKKKLFDSEKGHNHNHNEQHHNQRHPGEGQKGRELENSKISDNNNNSSQVFEMSKCEGLIGSISTLRSGINKEVFDVFFKSVRDGEKHRTNSLVIFIENWRHIDIDRIQPYVESYFESRTSLKSVFQDQQVKGSQIYEKMEECIPLRVGSRKGRNEINTWILSTIQFTKNQRVMSKNSLNNLLLFLFRLLTIQYRITYPMQGKSYSIDPDVRNELYHEIVKAINYIIQFK